LDYCEPLASVLSAQIAKMGVSCYQVFAGQDFITVLLRMILLETILAEKSAEALDSRTGRVQADAASMRNARAQRILIRRKPFARRRMGYRY
jgi:hypothetical protein